MRLRNWWSQRLQTWGTGVRLNGQVTAYGRQIVPDSIMWAIKLFLGFNHITGTAKSKVVKFCTQVVCINSINRVTYHLQLGRGYGHVTVFSERWLTFPCAICYRPFVCHLSSVCLSVKFMHPTQPVKISGNFSTPFGTMAIFDIHWKFYGVRFRGTSPSGSLNARGKQI